MKKALLITGMMIATIVIFISCSKDNDSGGTTNVNCDGVAKSWSADVSVIIQSFCNQAGCHNAGSSLGPGPLTNYSQVFAARSSIRTSVKSGSMPRNSTLTEAQKNAVICWIDSGAPNN